ncbi:MAG: outer membrane lipid asymmetry maintenance protein MlaD [Gammaproteobacteria bacterium]|nr:outer membrane lipid asymmetry maintenance protein MlaD [Gammaproteobacteria bacterium]
MTNRKLEVLVGVFVAAGFAALLVLAMQVSNLSTFSPGESYTLTARFDNIGGLKVRSPVTIGGVRVGRVSAIRYDPEAFNAVVSLSIDADQDYLPVDTGASIYTSGLLGEQYISLEPGAEAAVLKDGDVLQFAQSAVILEQLIGKFVLNSATK